MMRVMMEQSAEYTGHCVESSEEKIDLPRVAISEKKSSMKKEKDEEWMNFA